MIKIISHTKNNHEYNKQNFYSDFIKNCTKTRRHEDKNKKKKLIWFKIRKLKKKRKINDSNNSIKYKSNTTNKF